MSPKTPTEFPLEVPRDLRWLTPRYDFVRELGRGMAVVYLARERDGVSDEPGREVAVKVVAAPHAADRETIERFAREAHTATALRHPNIVRTLAIETSGESVAIVTEYVVGETLRAVLQARGTLPFDRAAAILRDIAGALAHAHEARIVHRDVKPENIFIETGTGRALLGDFGIARPIDADALLTQDGASLGTPAYMAPEQVDGLPVDERTDVYALGLVGWEMLAGRRPWQGETLYSLLQKQKHEALPDLARLRPDVPVYLHRAIEGALAKDPRARWTDAGEMLAALSPAPESLPEAVGATDAAAVGTGRVQSAGTDGTTMRFASGELDALRPADFPEPDLAVSPAEYARDEWAVAALPARPRRGTRRWVALAAIGTALAAAAALTASHRPAPPSSGDAQLDSLLNMTVARPSRDSAAGAGVGRATRGTVVDTARGSLARDTAAPATSPSATPPAPAPRTVTPTVASAPPATPPATPPVADSAAVDSAAADSPAPDRPAAGAPAVAVAPGVPGAGGACRSLTNADQRRCLMGLIYRNDAALNTRYQTLIGALRRQAGGAAEPAAVRALRVEQRAWVDARDAACAREVPLSRNAHWGVARAPCFRAFSQRRAAVLVARLRGRLPQAR